MPALCGQDQTSIVFTHIGRMRALLSCTAWYHWSRGWRPLSTAIQRGLREGLFSSDTQRIIPSGILRPCGVEHTRRYLTFSASISSTKKERQHLTHALSLLDARPFSNRKVLGTRYDSQRGQCLRALPASDAARQSTSSCGMWFFSRLQRLFLSFLFSQLPSFPSLSFPFLLSRTDYTV